MLIEDENKPGFLSLVFIMREDKVFVSTVFLIVHFVNRYDRLILFKEEGGVFKGY